MHIPVLSLQMLVALPMVSQAASTRMKHWSKYLKKKKKKRQSLRNSHDNDGDGDDECLDNIVKHVFAIVSRPNGHDQSDKGAHCEDHANLADLVCIELKEQL
ncbi:hypothetical protein EON65_28930 [archaeon]|nr:MAG: hypothetical protein EON65_28930 [archaeon]